MCVCHEMKRFCVYGSLAQFTTILSSKKNNDELGEQSIHRKPNRVVTHSPQGELVVVMGSTQIEQNMKQNTPFILHLDMKCLCSTNGLNT